MPLGRGSHLSGSGTADRAVCTNGALLALIAGPSCANRRGTYWQTCIVVLTGYTCVLPYGCHS
jgi:hypothetical protein